MQTTVEEKPSKRRRRINRRKGRSARAGFSRAKLRRSFTSFLNSLLPSTMTPIILSGLPSSSLPPPSPPSFLPTRALPVRSLPETMKLTSFFGSSPSSKKEASSRKGKTTGKSAKSCSFGSTASSLSTSDESVATPRTVLPPSTSPSGSGSGSGTTKKPAVTLAVTRQELEVALRSVVSTDEELAAMLADAETTALALEGIAAAEAADEGELRDIFAVFDADGDGRISAEELRAVLASLGDDRCSVEDCRRMIGGVDTDGDGFVCFGEFTRMMMHLP